MHKPITEKELRARLATNLRQHRAAQGISQEGLAALAGLHRTFVSQIERELKNLSLDSISKLANALKIDPSELLKS
nr:helix-turn-helix transcriptional regulator [uncultured Noviherbaspirillum sp.]